MKYITTKTHPTFKEGLKVKMSYALDANIYTVQVDSINPIDTIYLCEELLNNSISKGYIKEVEEKEYTKSDMIDFAKYYAQ